MDEYLATEEAYKNGKEAAARQIIEMIRTSAKNGQVDAEALIEKIIKTFRLYNRDIKDEGKMIE